MSVRVVERVGVQVEEEVGVSETVRVADLVWVKVEVRVGVRV